MSDRATAGSRLAVRCRRIAVACFALLLFALPQSAAGDDSTPQIRLGYSDGLVSDRSGADADRYLDAIASVVGQGGIIRASAHWDPSVSGPQFAKYDAFVAKMTERGMLWMPEIHLSHHGHYVLPGSSPGGYAAWQADIRAFVNRYQPGGSYAAEHPGFPGVTMYEIWNEPNTITGNTSPDHHPGDVDPATIDQVVETGAVAVRQAAADGIGPDFQPALAGFAIGSIDTLYIERLIAASSTVWSQLDMLTVHVYQSQPPTTCDPWNPHCVRGLEGLRALLDQRDDTHRLQLGITEGGYSGADADPHPPNVVSEHDQADWGIATIQWMLDHPELNVGLYTPFQALDLDSRGYFGNGQNYDYGYWYQQLGAVRANGALKPWGLAYRDFIDQDSSHQPPPGDTTPPTVPAGLHGGTPTLKWDPSTDDLGGPLTYLIYRDGALLGQTNQTSFTDKPPIAWGDEPLRDETFPSQYADGWGDEYDVAGDVSRYWTNAGRGMLQAERPGATTQVLLRNHVTRAIDQTLSFELSHAIAPTGRFRVNLLARVQGDQEFGDGYQGYVEFDQNGLASAGISKRSAGTLVQVDPVSGTMPAEPGVVYHLRMRVSGGTAETPLTRVRLKLWTGDVEPAYWNVHADDPSGLPAGRIGIATMASPDLRHAPITVLVDDWQARNLAAVGPVTYHYAVAAEDQSGNLSDRSDPLAVTFEHGGPDRQPVPGGGGPAGPPDHPSHKPDRHPRTHSTRVPQRSAQPAAHHATAAAKPGHRTAHPNRMQAGTRAHVCNGPLVEPVRC